MDGDRLHPAYGTRGSMKTLLILIALGGAGTELLKADGVMGGGGPPSPVQCVSQADRDHAQQAIQDYEHQFGPLSQPGSFRGMPEKFPFYPVGGTLYGDLFTNNFVDLDPSLGILDWDCTNFSLDGHDATDVEIRTFGEQAIGVPIFSVLDGTVIATHDGEDDMHTSCIGIANYVIIDHGNGRWCYYWHMRTNSVQVSVSQVVRAGDQIGLVGSSGCSTRPHLHFATYDNNGTTLVEPYAGPCRAGPSEWISQTPINRAMYLRDFNATNILVENYPGLPFDMPRTGTFVTGVRGVSFWINLMNMPANSNWRVRYRRPNTSIAFDSGTVSFGNPSYRWSWWWWRYNINLNTTGIWHILLDINGQTLIQAPFDVVASAGQIVNRAPNAVGVVLDPPTPRSEDTIFCRVQTSLTLDDPDYDIVRYEYVWTVNNIEVRRVTSAGHADAIPNNLATGGDVVMCVVTPGDGSVMGTSVSTSVTVISCGLGDVNQDGLTNGADIEGFIRAKLGQPPAPGEEPVCADFGNGGDLAMETADFVNALLVG